MQYLILLYMSKEQNSDASIAQRKHHSTTGVLFSRKYNAKAFKGIISSWIFSHDIFLS